MKSTDPFSALFHRPLFFLSAVFLLGVGMVAVVISYAAGLPAPDAVAHSLPQAPQQNGLEIQNYVQDKVLVYEWLTYTVVFTNASGGALQDVAITSTWATDADHTDTPLPAQYNGNLYDPSGVVDWYTWTLSAEAGALYIDIGDLPAGMSAQLVFTMSVPYTVPIDVNESLEPNYQDPRIGPSVLGNNVDIGTSTPGVANAFDTDATTVVGPVLKLSKSVESETGLSGKERPGRLVTYTLSLDNLDMDDGRSDSWPASHIVLWEILPPNLTLVDAQPSGSWVYEPTSRHITWTLPTDYVLNPGSTTHVTFTARIAADGTDYRIDNARGDCWATADERMAPVRCIKDLKLNVLSPLDKVVETRTPPGDTNVTYPNRYITYTAYVYNPLQVAVNDLVVTDTLPSEHFTYQGMLDGPNPVGSPTRTIVWRGLSLPANGVISFSFRVFVDPQTPVKSNCGDREYRNLLEADSAAFPVQYADDNFKDQGHDSLKVTRQIRLSKSVYPRKQIIGEVVTYTIRIENVGDTLVRMDVLTDVLPRDDLVSRYFVYDSMVSSVPGEPAGQSENLVWWDDIPDIGPGETFEFSFRALVNGQSLSQYANNVYGYSPDTYICPLESAPVKVLAPIFHYKTADPPAPEPIVQGESFQYSVSFFNLSSDQSYSIDQFYDYLPDGFEKDGSQSYIYSIDPPYVLLPNGGNTWEQTFSVDVVGSGAGTPWCDALGEEKNRTKLQNRGAFGVRLYPDNLYLYNAEKIAPVYIRPHVDLLHEYYPSKVGLGGVTTATLTLSNNLRRPPQAVSGIVVTYELPAELDYLGVVPPTPEPSVEGNNLVWTGINLPASGQVALQFRLRVPMVVRDYKDIRAYARAADPDICIPLKETTLSVKKGVVYRKTPDPDHVGPFGTVEYVLQLWNQTSAPARNVRVTDTLPYGFEFVEMTSNHTPISLDPLVWEIPVIADGEKEKIVFKTRAYVNLGPQYNEVESVSASTYVTREESLTKYRKRVRVDVLPGVGLYKKVEPGVIQAGETVTYTINLYNGSDSNMANIVLFDTLPDGFSFDEMVEGAAPTVVSGTLVIWEHDRLDKNQTWRLVFRAATDAELLNGTYYNQVSGEAEDAAAPGEKIDVPDTDLTAPVQVQGLPSIQRAKTVSPSSVRAGNWVTYTITLYNETDQSVTLRVTDTLPMSVTFGSVVGSTPAPAQTEPLVWDNVTVDALQTVTLTFRAWVDLYTPSGTYYNYVDAASESLQLPASGPMAPLVVEGIPRYDLQVTKSDGTTSVDEGDLLRYTIAYTNVNDADVTLTGVVITDTFWPLPPWATPLVGGDWTLVGSNVYTHYVGDLGPGASGTVQFSLQLSDTIPAEVWVISNTVEVGYATNQPAFESDPSNNQATDLDVLRGPDLVPLPGSLKVSPADPVAGNPITFSVTIRNQGKSETLNASNGAAWFIVELYLKGSNFEPAGPPADVFDHVGGWYPDSSHSRERVSYMCVPAGLSAGADWQCSFVITDVVDADNYAVYVQADVTFDYLWNHDYGMVLEAVETNNIASYGWVRIGGRAIYLPLIVKNH